MEKIFVLKPVLFCLLEYYPNVEISLGGFEIRKYS